MTQPFESAEVVDSLPPPDPLDELPNLIGGDEAAKDKALLILMTEFIRSQRRIAEAQERHAQAMENLNKRAIEYIEHSWHTVR